MNAASLQAFRGWPNVRMCRTWNCFFAVFECAGPADYLLPGGTSNCVKVLLSVHSTKGLGMAKCSRIEPFTLSGARTL